VNFGIVFFLYYIALKRAEVSIRWLKKKFAEKNTQTSCFFWCCKQLAWLWLCHTIRSGFLLKVVTLILR